MAVVVPGSGSNEKDILSSTSTTGGGGVGGVTGATGFLLQETATDTNITKINRMNLIYIFLIFIKLRRNWGLPNIPWAKISIGIIQGETQNDFVCAPIHSTQQVFAIVQIIGVADVKGLGHI